MGERNDKLSGLRILVVEDELLIAMDIQEILEGLRCEIVATVSTVADALARVRLEPRLDGALLDLNLQKASSLRVAEELKAKGVPFIVVTGYAKSASDLPVLRDAPRLSKPFSSQHLVEAMAATFAR